MASEYCISSKHIRIILRTNCQDLLRHSSSAHVQHYIYYFWSPEFDTSKDNNVLNIFINDLELIFMIFVKEEFSFINLR